MENLNLNAQSEEFTEIFTRVPSWIVRWGTCLLSGLLLTAVAVLLWIRVPAVITWKVRVQGLRSGKRQSSATTSAMLIMTAEQKNFFKIHPGDVALLKLESLPQQDFGPIKGRIHALADSIDAQGRYKVWISISGNAYQGQLSRMRVGMTGSAEIITEKKSLLSKVFSDQ